MTNNELETSATNSSRDPYPRQTFLKRWWPLLILAVILLIVLAIFHRDFAYPRAWLVFVLGAGVVWGMGEKFFPNGAMPNDPKAVRFVIAFDSVVFIVVGLAAAVLVCSRWEVALLLSGSCLLVGGFFGLLFGYPQ